MEAVASLKNNKINGERSLVMHRKMSIIVLSLLLIAG